MCRHTSVLALSSLLCSDLFSWPGHQLEATIHGYLICTTHINIATQLSLLDIVLLLRSDSTSTLVLHTSLGLLRTRRGYAHCRCDEQWKSAASPPTRTTAGRHAHLIVFMNPYTALSYAISLQFGPANGSYSKRRQSIYSHGSDTVIILQHQP